MSYQPAFQPAGPVPPTPRPRLQGVRLYLTVLATVYVVASLVLGILCYAALQSNAQTMQSNARTIEQLQTDTNDNLCNQQEYTGSTSCEGGDANGGSLLP
jgi:hypothetical protein